MNRLFGHCLVAFCLSLGTWLVSSAAVHAATVREPAAGSALLTWTQVENAPASPAASETKPQEEQASTDETNKAAPAETTPPRRPTFDKQSEEILKSITPIAANANSVTVRISTQGRPIALGVIVESDGYVLTKASELKGSLMCKLADGRSVSASVFGIHQKTDLALLKIEASQLPIARWSATEPPPVGHWVVTPKLDSAPGLGIVSVQPRAIRAPTGYVGVELRDHENGVRIYKILANSPAEKAGLQVNDVIVEVDGLKITDRVMLIQAIQKNSVGAQIKMKVRRGEEVLEFPVILTDQTILGSDWDRSEIQNEMGGRLSKRRLDFPMALQHDTPLSPNECGGPIVDLSGEIVGVNIARAGRVDSLALPAATVLSVIEMLKSGELRPELVHKPEIEKIQVRLAAIEGEMHALPERKTELDKMLSHDKARAEELRRVAEDLQNRIAELDLQNEKTASELNSVTSSESKLQKEKERLESELQKLSTGTN